MKDIKFSFPYPSTSRHNLSQDVGLSLSMGMVIPVRTIEVLPGDSHRIATSFSLISNPLVKPLLQGVMMRYCRFWVPRRIYHLDMRANNTGYDPQSQKVRTLYFSNSHLPFSGTDGKFTLHNDFQQSSLFDYLGYANLTSNYQIDDDRFSATSDFPTSPTTLVPDEGVTDFHFMNAEPYIAYVDICRNYFADSASGLIAWTGFTTDPSLYHVRTIVQGLSLVDSYIDSIQNSTTLIKMHNIYQGNTFTLPDGKMSVVYPPIDGSDLFDPSTVGISHVNLCVPLNRPDRLSRLFNTLPLTSQNAVVSSNEITISNLSFLSKLQRYLTRRFFGGTRYTDIMYSIFGQKVPHVDSPVLLDVFDYELGSELVASTNATETQNPGVLGGYFSASGFLTTASGSRRRRYSFNEAGYLMDVVYIMPRLFRAAYLPDYIPVESDLSGGLREMLQGNFIPDFNGIGWQQPAFVHTVREIRYGSPDMAETWLYTGPQGFCCEPSWQQYRTLPDVCHGALNPMRSVPLKSNFSVVEPTLSVNSPLFTFTDRPFGSPVVSNYPNVAFVGSMILASQLFSDVNNLNRVFGTDELVYDNIFAVFRYAHQSKRQVTKRFTLTFA